MLPRLVLRIFISLALAAITAAHAGQDCVNVMDPSHRRLGIGVLVADQQGVKHLAVGPYTGNSHERLLDELRGRSSVREVLWTGELRYQTQGDRIQILEANETSGDLTAHLPAAVFAPEFHEVSKSHGPLGPEASLSQMEDVRHEAATALASLQSVIATLQRKKLGAKRKYKLLADFRAEKLGILDRLNWVFDDLWSQSRLDMDRIELVNSVRHELASPMPTLKELTAINADEFYSELDYIHRILDGKDEPATDFFDF